MALEQRFKCRCGAVRRAANHWFAAKIGHLGTVYLYIWERALQVGVLCELDTIYFCGQACVQKLIDEWMRGEIE